MLNLKTRTFEHSPRKFILSSITEAEIFRHFFGFFKLGKMYISPLRDDDTNASFNIYVTGEGKLLYKDWGHSSGDCFAFVSKLKNTDIKGAYSLIINEMNLGNSNTILRYVEYSTKKYTIPTKVYARSKLRHWEDYDLEYWKQCSISSSTLEHFGIFPGKEVWKRRTGEEWRVILRNSSINPLYVFRLKNYAIKNDGLIFSKENGIKAYLPKAPEDSIKWFTGISGNYIQGLEQLPEDGDILFITSSLKDVCTLYQIGIPAIAPNAESSSFDENLMNYLKKRWNRIIVNYDSDKTGVSNSTVLTNSFGISYWNIPKEYDTKDVSDFVKKFSQEELINIISKKIKL